ncbi:MAG: hypothetical protein HYS34_08115, partial [Acidobacteria bacterium]|nr:hypothetical protein [Acidobacteriota bacterium]
VDPPIEAVRDRRVLALRRLGKRIVIGLEHELFLVLHLMIAGRLHWKPAGAKNPGKLGLAAFDFETGTLLLTDAGSKRRASLHLVRGEESLRSFERGGLELRDADPAAFRRTLASENHTTTGPPPSKSWRRTRRAHEFRYDTCTVRRRARA